MVNGKPGDDPIFDLLRRLDGEGRSLADLTAEEWKFFRSARRRPSPRPDRAIAARSGPGGPSWVAVNERATRIEEAVNAHLPEQPSSDVHERLRG